MRLFSILLLAVVGACCSVQRVTAPVDATAPEACPKACEVLRAFECREGANTGLNESCEALCRRDQALGPAAQLQPECVAAVTSSGGFAKCNVRCRK